MATSQDIQIGELAKYYSGFTRELLTTADNFKATVVNTFYHPSSGKSRHTGQPYR